MSVSGISSSSLFNQNSANVQNQQSIQQQFQELAQEFQAGSLSATQNSLATLEQQGLQNSSSSATQSTPNAATTTTQATHHFHHHLRIHVDAGPQPVTTPYTGSGGGPETPSGYNNLQQDLQQVALNDDLMTAQAAALQTSSSVSLMA